MHHQFQNILELLHVFERINIREREKKSLNFTVIHKSARK